MPLTLPEPDSTQLRRSPLQHVVGQIRFDSVQRAVETRVALGVQERLGGRQGRFSKLEPVQNLNIALGAQPVGASAQTGWRFVSDDGSWTAAVLVDQLSVETTKYDTWDGSFRSTLTVLTESVAELLEPAAVHRIGLRYINRIVVPEVRDPHEWSRYISAELLGLVLHERLGPGVMASQQQVDIVGNGDDRAILRHGFYREGDTKQLTYVLDIDTFHEKIALWDNAEISTTLDALNAFSLQLFQQSITQSLRDYFQEDGDG